MEKYNIGELWWTHFPFSDKDEYKRRPALVIGDDTIAILTIYVTSQNKEDNPYSILIEDWKEAGLSKKSWVRIDKIIELSEWNMDRKIGELSQNDLSKILQLAKEALTNTLHEFSLLAIVDSIYKSLITNGNPGYFHMLEVRIIIKRILIVMLANFWVKM